MFLSRFRVNVTCTASAAAYSQYVVGGYLSAVRYTTATASGFATGSTCIISVSPLATGPSHEVLRLTNTSVSAMFYPRREGNASAGATGAGLGQMIPVADEYVRIEIQGGGTSGQGTYDLYVEGR